MLRSRSVKRCKKYRVRLRIAHESYNGHDIEENVAIEVLAANGDSAYKKAEAILRKKYPGHWIRNGLGADLVS